MTKKPYAVKSKEFGRGPAHIIRFATLEEASAYIQARWQGIEYRDGLCAFHTDFCTYELVGFNFSHIGRTQYSDPNDVYSRYFVFDRPVHKAQPTVREERYFGEAE
jgi:hypothetical protein